MKTALKLQNTAVYDEALSIDDFNRVSEWMNYIPYMFKNSTGLWNRVWHTSDGEILNSQSIHINEDFSIAQYQPEYEPVLPFIKALQTQLQDCGLFDVTEIKSIALTPYVWPATTSLSWHSDSDYVGAFTFYVHKHWNPNWGGEFLTVEGDEYIPQEKKDGVKWKVFDNKQVDEMILDKGVGHFIMPKPNRIVFNKGGKQGILHKVAKSTPQATDRLTLQGFLRKRPVTEEDLHA